MAVRTSLVVAGARQPRDRAPSWLERSRKSSTPVRNRQVPILVGGDSDLALKRVARNGDGWIAFSVKVDEAAEKTTIQVKLANGKRERVVLNTAAHTVADLQALVAGFGAHGGRAFALVAGFPPKALDRPADSIEAAGLKNAAVTQQLA